MAYALRRPRARNAAVIPVLGNMFVDTPVEVEFNSELSIAKEVIIANLNVALQSPLNTTCLSDDILENLNTVIEHTELEDIPEIVQFFLQGVLEACCTQVEAQVIIKLKNTNIRSLSKLKNLKKLLTMKTARLLKKFTQLRIK
jgi:hypothetical protein